MIAFLRRILTAIVGTPNVPVPYRIQRPLDGEAERFSIDGKPTSEREFWRRVRDTEKRDAR